MSSGCPTSSPIRIRTPRYGATPAAPTATTSLPPCSTPRPWRAIPVSLSICVLWMVSRFRGANKSIPCQLSNFSKASESASALLIGTRRFILFESRRGLQKAQQLRAHRAHLPPRRTVAAVAWSSWAAPQSATSVLAVISWPAQRRGWRATSRISDARIQLTLDVAPFCFRPQSFQKSLNRLAASSV
jgi:hypothetical protein